MEWGFGTDRPKCLKVAALLEGHCDDIEADLAFRGIDIADYYRGSMSPRRLGVLLDHLPPESFLQTALRNAAPDDLPEPDPSSAGRGTWSNDQLLLAALVDGVNILAWQQVSMHSEDKIDPPARIPRPGVRSPAAARAQNAIPDAARGYLERLRASREGGTD
jgi:hypothetical protein